VAKLLTHAAAAAAAAVVDVLVAYLLQDSVGRTPLHYAASWGHADCINAVLSAHSGPPKPEWGVAYPNDDETRLVDVQNMAGFTPLHYAVWVGRKNAIQVRVLRLLLCTKQSIGSLGIAHYHWQQSLFNCSGVAAVLSINRQPH
jgi:ankyrin repeat protein